MSFTSPGRPFSELDLENEAHISDFVMSRWISRRSWMSQLEQEWMENIAFFMGKQWHIFNTTSRRMDWIRPPRGRERLVENYLLNIVLREVGQILKSNPTWKCVPATSDFDDWSISKVTTRVLQALWARDELPIKLLEAAHG